MLALYRSLLSLRRETDALSIGDLSLVDSDEDVLAYERRHGGERLLVALNLSGEARELRLPGGVKAAEVLLSSLSPRELDGRMLANEGLVIRLDREG